MSLAERLTDSEAKVRILALYHGQPDAQLSISDLRSDLDLPQREIREALRDFLGIGLLRSEPAYFLDQTRDGELQQDLIREMQADRLKSQEMPWRKSRQRMDIPLLDGLVPHGFPAPASLLVLAEPECEKEVLCQQVAAAVWARGQMVIYATTEQDPHGVKLAISGMAGEGEESIMFLDMFSPQGEIPSTVELSEHPTDLTDVSIALAKLIERGAGLLILDSCSTLLDLNGADSTLKFLTSLTVRCMKKGCSLLLTLNRKAYEVAVVSRFQALADGIIELKADEDVFTGITTYLRISKLRGTGFDSRWIEYQVIHGMGFEKKEV
ncbi:MAG: RAD55 family ATPase [Candidatus Geothermarchaeales archaeon]